MPEHFNGDIKNMSVEDLLSLAQKLEGSSQQAQSAANTLRQLASVRQQESQLLMSLPSSFQMAPAEAPGVPPAEESEAHKAVSLVDYVRTSYPHLTGSMGRLTP